MYHFTNFFRLKLFALSPEEIRVFFCVEHITFMSGIRNKCLETFFEGGETVSVFDGGGELIPPLGG